MTGKPFNVASRALLAHMVAQVAGLRVGDLVDSFGDTHLYLNHLDQAARKLDDVRFEDVGIEGHDPYPAIKAPIAV